MHWMTRVGGRLFISLQVGQCAYRASCLDFRHVDVVVDERGDGIKQPKETTKGRHCCKCSVNNASDKRLWACVW